MILSSRDIWAMVPTAAGRGTLSRGDALVSLATVGEASHRRRCGRSTNVYTAGNDGYTTQEGDCTDFVSRLGRYPGSVRGARQSALCPASVRSATAPKLDGAEGVHKLEVTRRYPALGL